jgi:hypothetical protein
MDSPENVEEICNLAQRMDDKKRRLLVAYARLLFDMEL